MATIADRARSFGQTIFSEITALAIEHGAVNLGQGFPDFQPPQFVRQAGLDAMAGPEQQYARGAGSLELTETLAELMGPSLGRSLDPLTEVTVTVGATEGLFAAAQGLINPGDEVLLIEPFYDSYPADVTIAGGVPRYVPLEPGPDGRWELDLERLERAFSPRTRAIFLNTPHNPTGKVFTRDELSRIAALCQRHDALAICDEVYEELLFDGRRHLRLASLPGMWERTLTISSVGKSFSVTGWKIGWVIGPAALSDGLRRIHQWIPFAVATPLQLAASRVLREAGPRGYYPTLVAQYQARRDRLLQILRDAGLRPIVPEGTYFVVADFSGLGDWADDDLAFCRRLTTEVGVAAIPPSAFYCPEHAPLARRLARFCFCKRDQTLDAAAERLSRLNAS
jgi:aspartate/methionine/tyrosine aminotransferase